MTESTPQKAYYKGNFKSCCLCLEEKNSDRFAQIFSKVGTDCKLHENVKDVIGIDIKYAAELPSKVCRRCKGQLACFADFKAKAIQVQSEINSNTTSKRYKSFSPTLQPMEKKRQPTVTENKSQEQAASSAKSGKIARSLFADGKPKKSEIEESGNGTASDILNK